MTCVFCRTVGIWQHQERNWSIGEPPPADVCPSCQDAPARQAWHVECAAIGSAMRLEAFGRGLPADRIAVTPEIKERFAALGRCP